MDIHKLKHWQNSTTMMKVELLLPHNNVRKNGAATGNLNRFRQVQHKDVMLNLCTTKTLFPNMCTLAQTCRVIPIHTAGVKRTFSQLKLIKTRTKNIMNDNTLDLLLQIATEGPPVKEFPLQKAVQLWAQKRISVP